MYRLNPNLRGLYCLRCGEKYAVDDYFSGCPLCGKESFPVNLSLEYGNGQNIRLYKKRMFRFTDFLPYESFPTLGEGNTPVIALERLAKKYNLHSLYIKNEFQNPTGSHKDRMSPLVVARAVSLNKKCVVAASSGNAGASLAAYAAAAGIQCKIITTNNMNPIWRQVIEMTGAELILTDTPQARWPLMKRMVEEEDWYPVTNFVSPPVGSNPFGIQGYKTVAYEIYEEFGEVLPGFVLVPSCRADLLWGVFEGFKDLYDIGLIKEIPRLVAVEPHPRISTILAGEDYRLSFPGDSSATVSIGGDTVTYQAIAAIKQSGGIASNIKQEQVKAHRLELAQAGFYLESSAATIIGALAQLIEDQIIPREASVLMLATSNGYKDYPAR